MIQEKRCMTCESVIKGRSDKRFCDDYCRSNFNNQVKAKVIHNPTVRTINKTLLKNRRILEILLTEDIESIKVSKEKLLFLGFHFGFITHMQNSIDNETTYCCYDYSYVPLQGNFYLLSKLNCADIVSIEDI